MAVKNDADAIERRVPAIMSVMSVMSVMCVIPRIRCRMPRIVAVTRFFRPVPAMPIAMPMAFGSGVMVVFIPVTVVPLALVPLFGSGPVVSTTFSGPGQYRRAATQQCGAQKEHK